MIRQDNVARLKLAEPQLMLGLARWIGICVRNEETIWGEIGTREV